MNPSGGPVASRPHNVPLHTKQHYQAKYDIIGSLPFELTVQVVEYLETSDIARCRMVSKRWHKIFLSDTIIVPLLRQSLPLLGMDGSVVPAANAMTYIRWAHGLRFARPIKKLFVPWSARSRTPEEIVYNSRRLCCSVLGPRNEIEMLNLETGERSVWTDEAEDELLGFAVSDRYLVMVSRDSLGTVWDLQTSRRNSRRLPSISPHIFIEKDKVIMTTWSTHQNLPIYVWDLKTNDFSEFGSFANLCLWHVDADKSVLVAFDINWEADPPEVSQTKWSLTGQQLDSKQFFLPMGGRQVDRDSVSRSRSRCYRNFGDKSVTQLFPRGDNNATLHLMYDYPSDNLSARWIESAEPINRKVSVGLCAILTPEIVYRWGNQLRRIAVYNANSGTTTLHPYRLDIREETGLNLLSPPRPQRWRQRRAMSYRERTLRPFGDNDIFGVASEDGAQIWFFNPKFLPDLKNSVPFLAREESG